MTNRSKLLALFASAAFVGLSGQAFALDGNDVLAKLNAAAAQGNVKITAASVETADDSVTLTDAKVEIAGTPETIPVGTVTMTGVEEDEGAYTVEKVEFQNVDFKEGDGGVTVKDISVSGLWIPAEATPGSLDGMIFYDNIHVGPVTVTNKGATVASIAETNINSELAEDESNMTFDAAISGISGDFSTVPDPMAKDAMEKLGLTKLTGEITMKGKWTIADGRMDIDEYAFDFENVGRLNITFSLSGYTLDFIKAMQEATKAASANPDQAAAQQALGMAMMGLAQQLSFNGASIRFDDAGITSKALDYAGAQQGTDGKQMAESIKMMMPMMLGQLNMPELQQQITTAVSAYLDDPRSIEIAAKPAQSVPVPQIMGAAMGAPQTLPQVLGVSITANE